MDDGKKGEESRQRANCGDAQEMKRREKKKIITYAQPIRGSGQKAIAPRLKRVACAGTEPLGME